MKKKLSILLLLALCLSLAACGGKTGGVKTDAPTPETFSALLTKDGTAFIPLADGTSVKINDDVRDAEITADRQRIVVLLTDGTLYVTDPKLEKKQTICDDCVGLLSYVKDDGFFYENKSGSMCRFRFADSSSLSFKKPDAYKIARNNLSILYAADNELWRLGAAESEPEKIAALSDGRFERDVYLTAISDDAETCVWVTEEPDGTQKINLRDGEDVSTIGSVKYAKDRETRATFSKDQTLLFISNNESDCAWIKKSGEPVVQVKLGALPDDQRVCANGGELSEQNAGSVRSLYFSVEADNGSNIYNISLNGDRDRVYTGVEDYIVSNDRIIFTNTDYTLFSAKLDGSAATEEQRIATRVADFEVTQNGKYIYFIKNGSESDRGPDTASLYCYKIGETEPVKVADNVACFYSEYSGYGISFLLGIMYNCYSTDGASVYFFKDGEDTVPDAAFSYHGTLMSWTYGDEAPTKLSSDVRFDLFDTISSGLSGGIDPKGFWFQKYTSVDSSENIYTDLMFYNGKEATKLASDIFTPADGD